MEAQRSSAACLLVLLLVLPGEERLQYVSRLWRLVFAWRVQQPQRAESQFSRLIRPLALGKADFACARGHRLRRPVEAASETM